MTPDPQSKATALAAGYTRGQELFNLVSILLFTGASGLLVVRLWGASEEGDEWLVGGAVLLGLLGSDLLTGIIHWACDTWGRPDTPVLGRIFIRSFREHHVDAMAITRHDFVQTNGEQAIAALPVIGILWLVAPEEADRTGLFVVTALFCTIFFTAGANQIHKWAHANKAPRVVAWLQRAHVFISKEHHARHHRAPYLKHYCITTGWMNAFLHTIGFFRRLEKVIMRLTGAVPRKDDLGEDAARALLARELDGAARRAAEENNARQA